MTPTMQKKEHEFQHLKRLFNVVNDDQCKTGTKEKAFLELWASLLPSVGKIVNKTVSERYPKNRPSNDLVQDAILESTLWLITNSSGWDPKKGAAPATWAFKKIAALTMQVVGVENLTLDIDETTEEGALRKAELEWELLEGSARGRTAGTTYAGESEVVHPFEMLADLFNPVVSLLLEALGYLLSQGRITDDAALICAERVTGQEYSIIAEYFGKSEPAIRKISERTGRELRKMNIEFPRYADLLKLKIFASGKTSNIGK